MNKIITFLLVVLLIPAALWGFFILQQVHLNLFGAFVVSHTHSVDIFASPIIKQALLTGFLASIALFILAIIAHVRRISILANTGFVLGVGIFAGIFILGLLQYHHVTDLLSTIPAAPNISSIEYTTNSDTSGSISFTYSLSWQKSSFLPQEIQMYRSVIQFYQAYFSSAYDMKFHMEGMPAKHCLEGIDIAYDRWKKEKHSPVDTFSVTCTAEANALNIREIVLEPGQGSIIFK